MYVCNALDASNACIEWVVYQPSTLVDQLSITKADMVLIGGSISGVLALVLAFVMVAKALKSL